MAKKDKTKAKKNDDKSADSSAGGGRTKLIIIMSLVVLLLIGGGAGAGFFVFRGKGVENVSATPKVADAAQLELSARGEPRYVDLDPDFTISMDKNDARQFVLIAFSVLTYYDDTETAIMDNLPIIRNNIILMIARKSTNELATLGGKAKLQKEIHNEVERIITDNSNGGVMDIEQVFFTKFLMQ